MRVDMRLARLRRESAQSGAGASGPRVSPSASRMRQEQIRTPNVPYKQGELAHTHLQLFYTQPLAISWPRVFTCSTKI